MRNKRRADIILDFTSLLDVTLLILFFFIMFSSFQTDNQRKEADEKFHKAEEALQQAEKKEKEAAIKLEEMQDRLEQSQNNLQQSQNELNELQRTATDNEKYYKAIEDFAYSENLKVICYTDRDTSSWIFEIRNGKEVIKSIDKDTFEEDSLMEVLDGTSDDMYILCEYIYDSDTYIYANTQFRKMKNKVQEKYKHFLVSETKI